ncbi:MAG: hypothetical protein Q9191_002538 [Dirinaria sp. TL-2023a]
MSEEPESSLNLNETSRNVPSTRHAYSDPSQSSGLFADNMNPRLEGRSSTADQPLPTIGEQTIGQDNFAAAATLGCAKVSFDGVHSLALGEYWKRRHSLRNMVNLDYLSLSEITFEWCESYDSKDWQSPKAEIFEQSVRAGDISTSMYKMSIFWSDVAEKYTLPQRPLVCTN